MGCICKKVTGSTANNSTADKSQKEPDSTQKSTSDPVESQIGLNRTKSSTGGTKRPASSNKKVSNRSKPPVKRKGSTHKSRLKIRTAILNGEPVDYEQMKNKYGVGKSTISSVVKELAETGHIKKDGKRWKLAS